MRRKIMIAAVVLAALVSCSRESQPETSLGVYPRDIPSGGSWFICTPAQYQSIIDCARVIENILNDPTPRPSGVPREVLRKYAEGLHQRALEQRNTSAASYIASRILKG